MQKLEQQYKLQYQHMSQYALRRQLGEETVMTKWNNDIITQMNNKLVCMWGTKHKKQEKSTKKELIVIKNFDVFALEDLQFVWTNRLMTDKSPDHVKTGQTQFETKKFSDFEFTLDKQMYGRFVRPQSSVKRINI